MKLSNLISNSHQTFARVFLAFNLFDSLFPHHATKLKENHQLNVKNSEPTRSKNDAAQARLEMLETGVMRCWIIGPNYTWCHPSRGAETKTAEEKRGRMKGFSAESLMEKHVVHQLR